MTEQQREALDFRQNIAIALLAVLAVLLFSRTELFHLGWETLNDNFLSAPQRAAPEQRETVETGLRVPLRFAATGVYGGVYGRYVLINTNNRGRAFSAVRRLFADALTVSAPFEQSSREDFLSAIRGASLYCDFINPLPLSLLAGLTGTELRDERPARAMTLTRAPDGVELRLWDGAGTYLRRAAPLSVRELDQIVSGYEFGGGLFAMDDISYENVSPLSLFLETAPSEPVYSAVSGLPDIESLLTAFQFNPLTKSRYTEANGTQVIMEGGRSVRIRTNGVIYYQDSGRGDLRIEGAGETPSGWEAANECAALLNGILVPQGCASVYPLEIRRQDNLTALRFGCSLDNLPALRADGEAAAVVTLDGRKIASLEIRPRRYAVTNTESLLLPVEQALGLAETRPGAELFLAYQDTGGARVNAQWFAAPGLGLS